MSIKTKLSLVFSLVVILILLLNNTLNYVTSRDILRAEIKEQMRGILALFWRLNTIFLLYNAKRIS
jgi:hypothetical protein